MDLKQQALSYFEIFSRKDLDSLVTKFNEDTTLRDWENSANGIEAVMAIYKSIFDSVETIQATPIAVYQDGNTIIAELDILINDTDRIIVTDIIKFVGDKISSVHAYKG